MSSVRRDARIAGFLYLLLTVLGLFGLIYVPSHIVVHGNPAATAANIAAHQPLLRAGITAEIVAIVVELFVALALYRLFVAVDRMYAVLIVILGGILPIPIYFMNALNWVAALLLAQGGPLAAFSAAQRDALILLFIKLHGYGFTASEIFAGLWLLPMGALVYRSGFLPRFLGVWLIAGGFAYVADSLCGLLFPQYSDVLGKVIIPLTLGELAFVLWLVVMGAKEPRSALQSA